MKKLFTLFVAMMASLTMWAEVVGGTLGKITWSFDTESGNLILSGEGAMPNLGYKNAPWSKYNIKSAEIKEGFTTICDGLFYDCFNLTSVTIPNSVTSIGEHAFGSCESLTSVNIPENVTSIGSLAFYFCNRLTSVTIPDGVTSIGNDAFFGVKNILYNGNATGSPWEAFNINGIVDGDFVYADNAKTILCAYTGTNANVVIPNSVSVISDGAFLRCEITSISIPNGVSSIGDQAFSMCKNLTSITIPDGVTSIGEYAFFKCSELTSIILPNSLTSIGSHAFEGCRMTSITLPNSLTSIGDEAFYNCSKLTSIILPNSFTSIGNQAFAYCSSLTSITIPEGVTSIGDFVFQYCSSLTKIISKSKVAPTTASDYALYGYFYDIYIPVGSTASYQEMWGDNYNYIEMDVTTAVDNIQSRTAAEGIYNLQGQKLDAPQRGINIINGRKVVVR